MRDVSADGCTTVPVPLSWMGFGRPRSVFGPSMEFNGVRGGLAEVVDGPAAAGSPGGPTEGLQHWPPLSHSESLDRDASTRQARERTQRQRWPLLPAIRLL